MVAKPSPRLRLVVILVYVHGVCVNLKGFVYVSGGGSHVVKIYDPRRNGADALLQTLGGAGDAPGQFNYPAGMCVDDTNTLMVVDYGNHRVQFFD